MYRVFAPHRRGIGELKMSAGSLLGCLFSKVSYKQHSMTRFQRGKEMSVIDD